MKNNQIIDIDIQDITYKWTKIADGDQKIRLISNGKPLGIGKISSIHFRTPPIIEYSIPSLNCVFQLEYDWLADETSGRLF